MLLAAYCIKCLLFIKDHVRSGTDHRDVSLGRPPELPVLRKTHIRDDVDLRNAQSKYKLRYSLENCDPSESSISEGTTNISTRSSHFNKSLDFKTNIVAERIVSKQFELLQNKKVADTHNKPKVSKIPCKINKLVAQRILEVDAKFSDRLRKQTPKKFSKPSSFDVIEEASKTSSEYSVVSEVPKSSRRRWISPSRPRFQLSTKRSPSRVMMSNVTVQANMEKYPQQSDDTQTYLLTPVRSMVIQVTPESHTCSKKIQTRMFKTSHIETDPIYVPCPTKYTNTTTHYSKCDQASQFFEYMSTGDLFCLEWINKNLFQVRMNLNNIIVDEKIREMSEIGTKSTLFSDVDSGF